MNKVIAAFSAMQFIGSVGNDFIDIHVDAGSLRTPNFHREVAVKFSGNDSTAASQINFAFSACRAPISALVHRTGLFNLRYCGDHLGIFIVCMRADAVII